MNLKPDVSVLRPVRARGGFTMVELIMVMLIIGIASALVMPGFHNTSSIALEGAARTVMSDLLFAQNEAIARQAARTVVFDAAAETYEIRDEDGDVLNVAWMNGAYRLNFATDPRYRGVGIESADFGGETQVTFDDLGAPDNGGAIEVGTETKRFRITLTAFTGRVSIAETAVPDPDEE